MKVGLQEVTALFINDKGTLTELGQSIADTFADGARLDRADRSRPAAACSSGWSRPRPARGF
jgi:hypothetical protein